MATNLQFSHMNDADGFLSLLKEPISFSLSGDNVLVSGVPGSRISVYRIFLVVGGDTTLTFKDGVSTDESGPLPMKESGAIVMDISNVPWFQTSEGNDLILSSTQSVTVGGIVYYQVTA